MYAETQKLFFGAMVAGLLTIFSSQAMIQEPGICQLKKFHEQIMQHANSNELCLSLDCLKIAIEHFESFRQGNERYQNFLVLVLSTIENEFKIVCQSPDCPHGLEVYAAQIMPLLKKSMACKYPVAPQQSEEPMAATWPVQLLVSPDRRAIERPAQALRITLPVCGNGSPADSALRSTYNAGSPIGSGSTVCDSEKSPIGSGPTYYRTEGSAHVASLNFAPSTVVCVPDVLSPIFSPFFEDASSVGVTQK